MRYAGVGSLGKEETGIHEDIRAADRLKNFFFIVSVKLKWVGSKLFFFSAVRRGGVLFGGSPPRVLLVVEGLDRCTDPEKSTR